MEGEKRGNKEIAIVYMVAGMSKRFGGGVKQFAEVGPHGESLIEYSLNQALPAGFSRIYFIVGNISEAPFREKFGDNYRGIPVSYALQMFDREKRERPWGTADAASSLNGIVNCPFVLCNGDNLYGEKTFKLLIEHLRKSDEEATIGYRLGDALPQAGKGNRGIFKINKAGYVESLREAIGLERTRLLEGITLDDLCSKNIYAMHPRTVELINSKVRKFKLENYGDKKIEAFLPDMISELILSRRIKMKIYLAIDKCLEVDSPEDVERVREAVRG